MKNYNPDKLIRPKLKLMSEEDKDKVHESSAEILLNTGIRVESSAAIEIFKKSGDITIDNNIVRIGRELIDNAINSAPSNVELYKKTGELAFGLGDGQGDETYFGIGVTNPFFQEIQSRKLVPFNREHTRYSVKLGDMLSNFDMVSTPGIPSDVEVSKLDLYSSLDMYANTDKPLVLLVSKEERIHDVFKLLEHLHGEISQNPFCALYVNPITPLVMNKATTDKMLACYRTIYL